MGDLRTRVPGHSLIDRLLVEWDRGTIHLDARGNVVVDTDAVSWYRGVVGECHIGALLASLFPRWTVLHSVPIGAGGGDIDHVVVGQGGVFVINTKYHPGKNIWSAGFGFRVDGYEHGYVRSAITHGRLAAARLSRVVGFKVPVTSVIVVVNPARMDRKAPSGDGEVPVKVVTDSELLFLFDGPPQMSYDQSQIVARAAIAPETWLPGGAPSTIGAHIAREFAALEEAVGPALAAAAPRPSAISRAGSSARASGVGVANRRGSGAPSRPRVTPRRPPRRKRRRNLLADLLFPVALLGAAWYFFAHYGDFIGR